MFVNFLLFPALILGGALYAAGHRLACGPERPKVRSARLAAFSLLCLPALSFLLYYLHLIREPVWYIEFRSFPGVEMLSSFWGLLFGYIEIRRPITGNWRYLIGNRMMLRLSLLFIFAPFAKPVLLPLMRAPFNETWSDGVCLQSTPATCGPCSLATVYRALGIEANERDIARGSFSGLTGTENWYLIRFARRHGLVARIGYKADLGTVTPPAILGVTLEGGAGHFITYLGDDGARRIIGDPLSGKLLLTDDAFRRLYVFSGMSMEFSVKTATGQTGAIRF